MGQQGNMNIDLLQRLVACHSTPGDEDEVITLLHKEWAAQTDWRCRALSRYALLAEKTKQGNPAGGRILVCAHADSPGFVVDSLKGASGTAIPLGGAHFDGQQCKMLIKTSKGKTPLVLRKFCQEKTGETGFRFKSQTDIRRGDRIAYAPNFSKSRCGSFLSAPFLDNRAGCFLLCELLAKLPAKTPKQILLAVTAAEEFTGFGASVLAEHLQADLVICLDTTYTNKEQGVELKKGPVLTLSDKSVLVPRKVHAALHQCCREWDIPLQDEVYNFSGTDARAFPSAGSLALVLPLLIPSDGNHTPRESIAIKDLQSTLALLLKLCTGPDILDLFQREAFTWSLCD